MVAGGHHATGGGDAFDPGVEGGNIHRAQTAAGNPGDSDAPAEIHIRPGFEVIGHTDDIDQEKEITPEPDHGALGSLDEVIVMQAAFAKHRHIEQGGGKSGLGQHLGRQLVVVQPLMTMPTRAEDGCERCGEMGGAIEVQADNPAVEGGQDEIFNREIGERVFGNLLDLQGAPPVADR